MITMWELRLSPVDKYPNRYRLRLKCMPEDVEEVNLFLKDEVHLTISPPFQSLSNEFNWGIYIWNLPVKAKERLLERLNSTCLNGKVVEESGAAPGGGGVVPGVQSAELPQELGNILSNLLQNVSDEIPASVQPTVQPVPEPPRTTVSRHPEPPARPAPPSPQPTPGGGTVVESVPPYPPIPTPPPVAAPQTVPEPAPVFVPEPAPVVSAEPAVPESLRSQIAEVPEPLQTPRPAEPAPPSVADAEPSVAVPTGVFESETIGLPLNARYTFKNFIVGPHNRFTHAAAMAVSDNPGKAYNPLFIYGGVGLGKTHLMQSIAHQIRKKKPQTKMIFVTTEKFVNQIIECISNGTIQKLRDMYSSVDLLMVDDIQFLAQSESTQEEFFHIFNTLHQANRQIIMTSDRPPKLLTTLEDRLKSRFEWGLIADIKSPSLETRVAILKRKSEDEHLHLEDNIFLYIASKLKSNVRELEGFLKRINAYASLTNQVVDIKFVKQLMSELLPEEELTEEEKQLVSSQEQSPPPVPPPVVAQHTAPAVKPPPAAPVKPAAPGPAPARPLSMEDLYRAGPVKKVEEPKAEPVEIVRGSAAEDDRLYADMRDVAAVEVAFFYPEGKTAELSTVKQRFAEVIKKHNLKYRIATAFDQGYSTANINYLMFPELCKTNKVSLSVFIGPPPDSEITTDEFQSSLETLFINNKISFEFIPWKDLNKEYRYLNLALDMALSKLKVD